MRHSVGDKLARAEVDAEAGGAGVGNLLYREFLSTSYCDQLFIQLDDPLFPVR
jgi:hypothetical protein